MDAEESIEPARFAPEMGILIARVETIKVVPDCMIRRNSQFQPDNVRLKIQPDKG
jgi:hypothetical protein